MSNKQYFLGFLLVCLAQVMFCCAASAGRESKILKINETAKFHGNLSQDSSKPSAIVSLINSTNNKRRLIINTTSNGTDHWKRNVTGKQEKSQQQTSANKTASYERLKSTPTMKVTTTVGEPFSTTDHCNSVVTAHAQPSQSPAVMVTITHSLLEQNFTKLSSKNDLDSCTTWEQCPVHHHPLVQAWLHSLPACPCHYPYGLYYNNTLYDKIQGKLFAWRNVNSKLEKLAVFKPTAAYCIRQLLSSSPTTTATQQCCYDRRFRLITRGSGTGTPNLVAPELDEAMHNYVDLMPYILCQGDWTRYQAVRPPNNALKCRDNPKKKEFCRQLKRVKEF